MSKNYIVEANQINLFDQRWYEIPTENGTKIVRSVTTFLEAFPKGYGFRQWLKTAGFNADLVLEKAQQFGSAFHGIIERLLKGETIEWNEEMEIRLWERLMVWLDFWRELNKSEIKYKKDFIETIVYDLDLEYAGTVDFVCRVDNELTIIDWKTSNYISDHWGLQLAAYAKAFEKMYGTEVKNAWIVWFPEAKPNQKGYRILNEKQLGNMEDNFQDFLHTQQVYLRANQDEKPKYKTYPTKISLETL